MSKLVIISPFCFCPYLAHFYCYSCWNSLLCGILMGAVEAVDEDISTILDRQVQQPRNVAARPPFMFQYFETQGTNPFWQMVDDSYQELLSHCFCGSVNPTSSGDLSRTLNLRKKCVTPGCFRLRNHPDGCSWDRCCLKGRDTGCTEHEPECDQEFLHYHGWPCGRDPTDVIPLRPPTEYRLDRHVRQVTVEIVKHESQPLRDENGYDYNLWWQYKDDRGWKNFDLEANKHILVLMQKRHERDCCTEVQAWDGSRFQKAPCHLNFLTMTATFQGKQWPMRLVILEAYG